MSAETENKIYCATTGKFIKPPVAGTLEDEKEYSFERPCSECTYWLWLKTQSELDEHNEDFNAHLPPLQLTIRVADVHFLPRVREKSGVEKGVIIEMCSSA